MTPGLVVLVVVCGAGLSIVVQSLRLGISPMPTSRAVRRTLLELLPASARVVHELGAGWGTLVVPLSRALPSARIVAWEASAVPCLVLWLRVKLLRLPNVEVRFANFFKASLADADLVVCYLWTGAMKRLDEKLRAELKPGATVLSNTFALHGWEPQATRTAPDLYRSTVFRYVIS